MHELVQDHVVGYPGGHVTDLVGDPDSAVGGRAGTPAPILVGYPANARRQNDHALPLAVGGHRSAATLAAPHLNHWFTSGSSHAKDANRPVAGARKSKF